MLAKAFRADGLDGSEKLLDAALKPLKQPSLDDLYVAVGNGNIGPRDVVNAVYPELRPMPRALPVLPGRAAPRPAGGSAFGMPISGLVPGMAIHYAGCCHPLPGDQITGIVTTGKGVTIHTRDCATLESFAATPERFIDVDWEPSASDAARAKGEGHTGRVNVTVDNDPAALSSVTNAISKQGGEVVNLRIVNRQSEFCEMLVDVEVRDLRQLVGVIAGLRAARYVHQAERAKT